MVRQRHKCAGIGTQQNAHARPRAPDLRHDARDLFDGPGRRIDVGAPQLGGQQVAPAEDVERQVAVAIIVPMEEPAFLMAVDRIVGGVEVEDDLFGRAPMAVLEERHEQHLDGRRIVADLVVLARLRRDCPRFCVREVSWTL